MSFVHPDTWKNRRDLLFGGIALAGVLLALSPLLHGGTNWQGSETYKNFIDWANITGQPNDNFERANGVLGIAAGLFGTGFLIGNQHIR